MSDTDIDVRGHVAGLRHERGECGPDCSLGECENCHWNPVAVTVSGLGLCEKCYAQELARGNVCELCGQPIPTGSTVGPPNVCRSCWELELAG